MRCATHLHPGESMDVKLSELRSGRRLPPRRPVICIGSSEFCVECIAASQQVAAAMERCDFLVVPVLNGAGGKEVELAADGLSYVGLPKANEGWELLQEMQNAQVRSQGLDEARGQAIIVKKNGRAGA